jgi:hypothetical protein
MKASDHAHAARVEPSTPGFDLDRGAEMGAIADGQRGDPFRCASAAARAIVPPIDLPTR